MHGGALDGGCEGQVLIVAPHVRAAILARCKGDRGAAEKVLAGLDADRRRGLRALPVPPDAARGRPVGERRRAASAPPRLLLALADTVLREGDTAAARRFVCAAGERTQEGSALHDLGRLLFARISLAEGCVLDAGEAVLPFAAEHHPLRAEAAPVVVLAHTCATGMVPPVEGVLPEGDAARRDGYRRAVGIGAALSAERRDPFRTLAWLGAASRTGMDRESRATLIAWCDAVGAGEHPVLAESEMGRQNFRVPRALMIGLAGDADEGLRVLARPDAAPDPIVGAGRAVPLVRAREGVAETLLHIWAGRIGLALSVLSAVAEEAPVALVFAGLALPLARRLELAVHGRTGALSGALMGVAPWPIPANGFVDRGIRAYLRGRTDEAAVHLRLWADLGAPEGAFALPGLDEAGPFVDRRGAEPREARSARELRARIRAARAAAWTTELAEASTECAVIRSPFERARVEALLGASYATRGEAGAAQRHLRAAHSLFEESGALAWRAMTARRLARFAERHDGSAPEPAAALEVCRAAWEPSLTPRELDVALRMAEGRTNREIARELHVSVRTVEVHGGRIFAKLDVRTRTELTVLAHRVDQNL